MLDKLIAAPTATDANTLNKIAGDSPICWTSYKPNDNEVADQAEYLTYSVLSAIKAAEEFMKRHPDVDFSNCVRDADAACDRVFDLWMAATKKRREEAAE